jgi:hypothetical protein
MRYRIDVHITDGAKVYHDVRDSDEIPALNTTLWVNTKGFIGDVVIHAEMGTRRDEDGITHVTLSCYPNTYSD